MKKRKRKILALWCWLDLTGGQPGKVAVRTDAPVAGPEVTDLLKAAG
jgi:hypothetical protein